ncbi:SDR family NAD(P)-dependent oxidoreductase [Jannaschia sp. R86511]|uniref:SDR family NAD(P)-dependent oxidoreductase n=1 Tax=Jannaschia sp. R86511 TaxID=3093853 RepID=UPI0036D36B53
MSLRPGPVLVTGCSTGIGRAVALRLARDGHVVHATARRPDTIADLEAAGCSVGPLDVVDPDSAAAAVEHVLGRHGRIGGLVNNAGYAEYGPLEEVPLAAARRQLETNVIGLVGLTQLVLPHMRAAGAGRVVNIGSVGGRVTFPAGGWYHASKYALESLSDALRVEVAPFGVRVSLVEPGPIRTAFGDTAVGTLTAPQSVDGSPYGDLTRSVETTVRGYYDNPLLARGTDPVVRAVVHALTSQRPRSRYLVTPTARLLVAIRRWGGDRGWDAFVRRQFSVPGLRRDHAGGPARARG